MNNTPKPKAPLRRLMTLGANNNDNLSSISNHNSNSDNNDNNDNNDNVSYDNVDKPYSTSRSLTSSNFHNKNRSTTAPRNNSTNSYFNNLDRLSPNTSYSSVHTFRTNNAPGNNTPINNCLLYTSDAADE